MGQVGIKRGQGKPRTKAALNIQALLKLLPAGAARQALIDQELLADAKREKLWRISRRRLKADRLAEEQAKAWQRRQEQEAEEE